MADFLATNEFPGTGAVMQVEINFAGLRPDLPGNPAPYLETDDVKAVIVTPATATSVEVQVPVALVKVNNTTFNTDVTVIPVGKVLRVYRETDIEFPLVDFVSLQVVSESDLDNQARQVLYAVMEARDNAALAVENVGEAQAIAVAANLTSQEALATAEEALVASAAAVVTANTANATANAADLKSDQALAAAASAEAHATNVEVLAQQAGDDADTAQAAATQAAVDAAGAVATANGIDAKAQQALDDASSALSTANTAFDIASDVDGKAQTALDDSAFALTTAGNAISVANGVDAKAQQALDDSATAITTANAAQPGDATLTALAALTTAADQLMYATGADAFALTTLTAFIRTLLDDANAAAARTTLGVLNVAPGYIDGLVPEWVSATSIRLGTGTAYIPGSGTLLTVPADLTLSGLTLTAATWYYLYLYDNAGTAAIELVTTAPAAPYSGTARAKTGDTSRRFIGAFRVQATNVLRKFLWCRDYTYYADSATLYLLLNTVTSLGPVTVGAGSFIPPTTRRYLFHVYGPGAGGTLGIGAVSPESQISCNAGVRFMGESFCTSAQEIYYGHAATVTSGGSSLDIRGYGSER